MGKAPEISWLKSVYLPALSGAGKAGENATKEALLLVMHGLGDSLEGYRFLPQLLKIPGLSYLLVNAPDPYFTGYSWFDIYGGDSRRGIIRSRELLFGALDELEAQGWSARQTGIFGFSQGCLMAIDLACRYPKVFGAVVGVSGMVGMLEEYPEKLSPVAREQKLLVTHGTMDPVLPLAETQGQVAALKGMGMSIDWRVYDKEHSIEPYGEVEQIRSFLIRNLLR